MNTRKGSPLRAGPGVLPGRLAWGRRWRTYLLLQLLVGSHERLLLLHPLGILRKSTGHVTLSEAAHGQATVATREATGEGLSLGRREEDSSWNHPAPQLMSLKVQGLGGVGGWSVSVTEKQPRCDHDQVGRQRPDDDTLVLNLGPRPCRPAHVPPRSPHEHTARAHPVTVRPQRPHLAHSQCSRKTESR